MQGRSGASGKVAGCQWGDLYRLADGRLHVNFKPLKGGKQATDFLAVPVATAVLTWLYSYYGSVLGDLSADTPLWVSLAGNGTRGGRLSGRSVSRIADARLGESKVHALRHTVAVQMERAGVPVSAIQKQLRHICLATTGIYLAQLTNSGNPTADKLAVLFAGGGTATATGQQVGKRRKR